MDDRLISVAETAQTLGVSRMTTRRLIKRGQLRSVRVGNRVLVPASELERVILRGCGESRRAGTTKQGDSAVQR